MLKHLKEATNYTRTWNGAVAKKSTLNEVLDLYARGGAVRKVSEQEIISLVDKAYATDPIFTLATIFYLGDVRGGQGERRFRRIALRYLAIQDPQNVAKIVELVPMYGRWDDIVEMFMGTPLQSNMVKLIYAQLRQDIDAEKPSLLAKWLPSANAGKKARGTALKLIKLLDTTEANYRKTLSGIRKKIDLLETKLVEGRYVDVDYSKLPANAYRKYLKAFYRNDEQAIKAFAEKAKRGEVKVNASTLYPYDIVRMVWHSGYYRCIMSQDTKVQADILWNNLPDYLADVENKNILTMVDTSGSMHGDPIMFALSLGIYTAERLQGPFHNHFLTFSNRPQLQKVVGTDLYNKVKNMNNAHWDMNTNVEAAFDLVLSTAIKNNVPQNEVPSKILIISDMQFDRCARSGYNSQKTLMEKIAQKWRNSGYNMPQLMFWNVNARADNYPAGANDAGVILVSGASPVVLKYVLNGSFTTPLESMIQVLSGERYRPVFEACGVKLEE